MRLVLIGLSVIALIAIFEWGVEAAPIQQNQIDLRRRWSFKSMFKSLFHKKKDPPQPPPVIPTPPPVITTNRMNESAGELEFVGSFDFGFK